MEKEINEKKPIRILTIDGSDVYRAMHVSGEGCGLTIKNKKGKLDTTKFRGFLDSSLDTDQLQRVYTKHRDKMPWKFIMAGEYTAALVNVSFDYSVKEFYNRGKNFFVKDGYDVHHDELDDHVYVSEENGEKNLIAIEVVGKRKGKTYDDVKNPLNKELLSPHFRYDEELKAYFLNKDGENSPFVVKENRHQIREYLYENGFDIDGIHYVRYKRSAGSSREGHCLFIPEALYDDMMEWSLCGVDAHNVNDQASLQAYISLTLSSIEKKIHIPRQSILIINDQVSRFHDTVIKVSENGDGLKATKESVTVENVIWDGEALLDSSVFEENGYGEKGMMLLRNRFFKTCAFNTNLQEWFKDNGITKPSQLNGYYSKKTRSINDIKLVITESSLKYLKFKPTEATQEEWFEAWLDNIFKSKEDSLFGVVKTDKPTGPMKNRMVKTNYQLLNTLALSKADIKNVLSDSLDFLHSMQSDPMYLRYHANLFVMDEYDEDDRSTVQNYRQKLISDIMQRTDDFERTAFYRNYRRELCLSYKERLKRGRIMVNGGYHTLLGNGIEFLHAIIDKNYVVDEPLALADGEIYTPKFKIGERLLCQRSPHITMGNLLVAENKYVEEIEKYFNLGSANAIVCVNAIKSNLQQRLNGCDYDSDAMLITNNPILRDKAWENFDKFPVPFCDVLPIGKASYTDSSYDLAELDIKISENKIGEIVNLSQFLNSLYWQGIANGKLHSEQEELYADICKLAVLSGMEIDKAKRLFKVSADVVLDELRKYKTSYKREHNGQIPEFFAFITENEKASSEDLSMDTAMSYVYDEVKNDNARAVRVENVPYVSFFEIDYDKKDPTGAFTKRRDSVLEFVKTNQEKIRRLNFILKSMDRLERAILMEEINELYNECKEKIASVANDHLYALLLLELDKGKESKKGITSFNALLFASMCYANDGYLMKKLKKPQKEMYDLLLLEGDGKPDVFVFGHGHVIARKHR